MKILIFRLFLRNRPNLLLRKIHRQCYPHCLFEEVCQGPLFPPIAVGTKLENLFTVLVPKMNRWDIRPESRSMVFPDYKIPLYALIAIRPKAPKPRRRFAKPSRLSPRPGQLQIPKSVSAFFLGLLRLLFISMLCS